VMKGTTVLPDKSCSDKNVVTGGAIVFHQFGEPTNITSYDLMFAILVFKAGL